jgi:hypothetical protein
MQTTTPLPRRRRRGSGRTLRATWSSGRTWRGRCVTFSGALFPFVLVRDETDETPLYSRAQLNGVHGVTLQGSALQVGAVEAFKDLSALSSLSFAISSTRADLPLHSPPLSFLHLPSIHLSHFTPSPLKLLTRTPPSPPPRCLLLSSHNIASSSSHLPRPLFQCKPSLPPVPRSPRPSSRPSLSAAAASPPVRATSKPSFRTTSDSFRLVSRRSPRPVLRLLMESTANTTRSFALLGSFLAFLPFFRRY